LDKQTSEIMSCNVVSSVDNDETGEITHDIHKIGFTTIVFDGARLPKVDMKDIEWAAEGS
jgi:hypothetical protein